MTSWERFKRAFEHRDADRIPITDEPWDTTVRRWHHEGMPDDTDWCDYFDIDKVAAINIDISPRFPQTVVEETDRYIVTTSPWGVTVKKFQTLPVHARKPGLSDHDPGGVGAGKGPHDFGRRPHPLGLPESEL